MKVAYLMSLPTLKRTDQSSVHVAFAGLSYVDGYVSEFVRRQRRGDMVVQVSAMPDSELTPDSYILWSMGELREMPESMFRRVPSRGVVVDSGSVYEKASKDDSVGFIAVPPISPDGVNRILFLKGLIDSGKIAKKNHVLFGVPNPAELGMYPELFSAYVNSLITLAVCESCFQYSMYGARFSTEYGALAPLNPRHEEGSFLGMQYWVEYTPSREQLRVFHYNAGLVREFSGGLVAAAYAEKLYGILEGAS